MQSLYRILMRLTALIFGVTFLSFVVLFVTGFRETTWSNVHWDVIAIMLFGPAGILASIAWVVKPPPERKSN